MAGFSLSHCLVGCKGFLKPQEIASLAAIYLIAFILKPLLCHSAVEDLMLQLFDCSLGLV